MFVNFESSEFNAISDYKALISYVAENVKKDKPVRLFFDEIQEVDGWEKALRSFMVDYDADIYVTGSNASMLSSDLATHITGRYVRINVYPFSFKEYSLAHKETGIGTTLPLLFNEYINQGGFPFQCELGFQPHSTKQYLADLLSTVLYKDVMQHEGLRDAESLSHIVSYAIQEIGHPFSAKNISAYLKSERRKMALETVYSYIKAAEHACLLFRVPREDALGKKALKFNEKLYVVDQGLRSALGLSNESAIDQVLENIVYIELLRRGYTVKVGKVGDCEIDFVATKCNKTEYYQVTYLMADENTRNREFGSLEALSDNWPKFVLSLDPVSFEQNGIHSVNIIDWLLE